MRRPDPGSRGFAAIIAVAAVAATIGIVRWVAAERGAAVDVAGSDVLLWLGAALAAVILLAGSVWCARSVLYAEGSQNRARAGLVIGVALVYLTVWYGSEGGFARIVAPLEPMWGETPGESPALHVSKEYRFSLRGSSTPQPLSADDLGGWDYGVRFTELPGGATVFVEARARKDPGVRATAKSVDIFLKDTAARYEAPGRTLVWATRGRLNGHRCVVARLRTTGYGNAEPVVNLDYWIPGDRMVYLVSCIAYESDWPKTRARCKQIARTFTCW